MAGRPPKPTALKVLEGTAQHNPQRLNRREPKVRLGALPPPWLPAEGVARAAWDRNLPILMRMRVLTEADAEALAIGCLALQDYLASKDDENWRKADAAWKRYASMLGWFGMNPSARTKVQAAPAGENDPVAEWAAR